MQNHPAKIISSAEERLTAACILSTVGGILDIYTYLCRGRVFANAVTGNMVLLGLNLAQFQLVNCTKYLLAILFYALGVLAAEYIHKYTESEKRLAWHQYVLLTEIICLLPVFFVPYGKWDFAVNSLISFVCALQVQTFRRVHGLPFASTMCTGNLRSGTEAVFRWLHGGADNGELGKAGRYYLIISCFVGGAVLGGVLLNYWGYNFFWLAPLGLVAAFFVISSKRQVVLISRRWRKKK